MMRYWHTLKQIRMLWMVFNSVLLTMVCLTGCSSTSSHRPADWETQLTTAQQEASRIRPGAVLDRVSTDSIPFSVSDDIPSMRVNFDFIDTAGNIVHLQTTDTKPVRILSSTEWQQLQPIPSADELSQRETIIETIQLTAADAIKQTVEQELLQDFAETHEQVVVETTLSIETSYKPHRVGDPPVYWHVQYSNNQGAEWQFMAFYVNAQTGEIFRFAPPYSLSDLYPDQSEQESDQ